MKHIFMIVLILFTSVVLQATTKREYKINNEDVDILVWYNYELGQKNIIVNCEFTNISDTLIFVRKFNEGEWNKKLKYEFDPNIYDDRIEVSLWLKDLINPISMNKMYEQRDSVKMYELQKNEKIKFTIELEFTNDNYDFLTRQNFIMNFSYLYYSPILSDAYKKKNFSYLYYSPNLSEAYDKKKMPDNIIADIVYFQSQFITDFNNVIVSIRFD